MNATLNASPLSSVDAQCHEWAAHGLRYAGSVHGRRILGRNIYTNAYARTVRDFANRIIALRTQQAEGGAL